MLVKLKKIGNSRGLIIPKKILDMCELNDEVSMVVENQHIIISTSTLPRADWEKRFEDAAAINIPEKDMFAHIPNDFDEAEWTW